MKNERLTSLQVLRGLAAVSVVFHHSSLSAGTFVKDRGPQWLDAIFQHAYLGVDFFFILSGFIILNSHFEDPKRLSSLRVYGVKRFCRIFPPYWPISIVLLAIYSAVPAISYGTRTQLSIVSSLLLFPAVAPPALSVAWTLIHEAIFYVIFILYFVSTRVFVAFVALWAFAILLCPPFVATTEGTAILRHVLAPINVEFILGMGVAVLCRSRFMERRGLLVLIVGAIGFIGVLQSPLVFESQYRYLIGFPFAALVLGSVLLERQKLFPHLGWMVLLGDASYAIYLTHNPLISVIGRFLPRIHASWSMAIALSVTVSILVGLLYHFAVEKPLIRWFRTRLTPVLKPVA